MNIGDSIRLVLNCVLWRSSDDHIIGGFHLAEQNFNIDQVQCWMFNIFGIYITTSVWNFEPSLGQI